MRGILLCLVLVLTSSGAEAQGRWRSYDGGSREIIAGASVCPMDDAVTANYFCFGLSCSAERPLSFEVLFAGGEMADEVTGVLEVDGLEVARLPMARVRPPEGESVYYAAYDPAAHGAAVEALKGGTRATVSLVSPVFTLRHEMGLRWSARMIEEAMAACGSEMAAPVAPVAEPAPVAEGATLPVIAIPTVPAPAPAPDLPAPALEVLAEVRDACIDGTVTVQEGFVTETDLDLDGVPDLVVDYGGAACSSMGTLFCGSAGCLQALYRQLPGGGYDLVYRANIYGFETNQVTVTEMSTHGSYCGRVGAEGCTLRFVWEDGKLVPLE
ncbi:hypothetical protein [Pseudoruegeria sp. HB172150]|uniref:hypothetical protein n=1 Tax=Pseudoruegeria sp. HB172150 TaxID=2721164 RepID=UPI0015518742|nr:hypothetical protein [Pseudoruegeria sp. HB172150]